MLERVSRQKWRKNVEDVFLHLTGLFSRESREVIEFLLMSCYVQPYALFSTKATVPKHILEALMKQVDRTA